MAWSLQKVPELSDEQFQKWRKLLEDRAGICLSDQQRTFLQTHVSMRMREKGFENFEDYYDSIVDGLAGKLEWSLLIDGLVVQETQFFRHPDSYTYVEAFLNTRLNHSTSESFDVWSVGCSSGEEPYSLAMLINNVYQTRDLPSKYAISCTDISRAALTLGRTGLYNSRKVDLVDVENRSKYFSLIDQGQYQICKTLSDRICFSQGNVLKINEMPKLKVDLIYCQNLLVYFRRELRENVLNAFVDRLKPGGTIVIGLGELVGWEHPSIVRVRNDAVQAYLRREQ